VNIIYFHGKCANVKINMCFTSVHKNCTIFKYCLCLDITRLNIKTRIQVAIFPLEHGLYRVALSVHQLATGWTVRGSNPGGGEIFRTCSDMPWGPPSLLHNGFRVFPGGKERPGRDADPSPPSSAMVMKE